MARMKMYTQAQLKKLIANGKATAQAQEDGNEGIDHKPVVKYFLGGATWLISEVDPENPDIAFGLCDLGMGCPEMGSVSLSEIWNASAPVNVIDARTGQQRAAFRQQVERDLYFTATKGICEYANDARAKGYITT